MPVEARRGPVRPGAGRGGGAVARPRASRREGNGAGEPGAGRGLPSRSPGLDGCATSPGGRVGLAAASIAGPAARSVIGVEGVAHVRFPLAPTRPSAPAADGTAFRTAAPERSRRRPAERAPGPLVACSTLHAAPVRTPASPAGVGARGRGSRQAWRWRRSGAPLRSPAPRLRWMTRGHEAPACGSGRGQPLSGPYRRCPRQCGLSR